MTIGKYKMISEGVIGLEILASYNNNEGNIYSDIEDKYGDKLTEDEILEKISVMGDKEIMNKAIMILLDILYEKNNVDILQEVVDRFEISEIDDINECIIFDLLADRLRYIESINGRSSYLN